MVSDSQRPPDERNRRKSQRHNVLIGVRLRRPGESWFASQISDLSEIGFQLHSHVALRPGMTVWIMFSGFEGRRATVMWTNGHETGCQFEAPLHRAILDHILRMDH